MWGIRRFVLSVARYLSGAERRRPYHLECRSSHGRVTAALRAAQTSELHQRMKAQQTEADLYDLEVSMIAWGHRNEQLVQMLALVDTWRERRRRAPMGQMRTMLESGELQAVEDGGRARLVTTERGAARVVDINRRGLIAFLVLATLAGAAGPAHAESIAVSAAFQFTPQVIDIVTTHQCLDASNAYASCYEGNPALVRNLDVKKLALASVLTVADHEAGKRSKTLPWALRGFVWVLAGYVAWNNKKNEASVRRAAGGAQ